jgi:clathrin heavy chain
LQQTLESDSFICIREKKDDASQPEVVIVDLKQGNNVTRRPIKADSAIMHWTKQIIALRAQSRTLQIFDLEQKQKLKSATMNEDVVFWKWVSESTLGLVTETAVFHWDIFDSTQAAPVEVFKRNANLTVCRSSSLLCGGVQCTIRLLTMAQFRAAKSSTTESTATASGWQLLEFPSNKVA